MVEESSVRRFAEVVGGTVYGPYGPYPSSHAKRQYWLCTVEGEPAFGSACRLLAPFLSEWRLERVSELGGLGANHVKKAAV
jgi:hypothetical protein